jgi:hypothetical protein
VADELNAQGLTVQEVLSKFTMEIDWTPEAVKDLLWKRAQKGYLKKTSTTELEKGDVDPVYEHVNRFLSQAGVHVPFPSKEADIAELTHKNLPSRR